MSSINFAKYIDAEELAALALRLAAGIPSLTFGCARRKEENGGRLYLDIGDLVTTATVYAQVAQGICDQPVHR